MSAERQWQVWRSLAASVAGGGLIAVSYVHPVLGVLALLGWGCCLWSTRVVSPRLSIVLALIQGFAMYVPPLYFLESIFGDAAWLLFLLLALFHLLAIVRWVLLLSRIAWRWAFPVAVWWTVSVELFR